MTEWSIFEAIVGAVILTSVAAACFVIGKHIYRSVTRDDWRRG